ncbi:carbohydrate esterase family 8 protein [Stipitochalara longipes BDJ]|nr:carbohydrate esterase family 8 protein [Stipitochalara longipes BDJ]
MYAIILFILSLFALVVNASPTPSEDHPSRTVQKRSARTANPGGCLEVQGTSPSSSQYSTLGAAVTALGSGTTSKCIFIWPGTYTERVTIQYGGALTIYGYSANTGVQADNQVTITTSETSSAAGNLDASSALHLYGNNYSVWNINIKNTYGAGADDFIFGNAAAWFGDCTIACNGGGSITANNRASSTDPAWYVFDTSTITAASGWTTTGANYLGRPWGVDARVIFQKCKLSNVVNAQGWTTLAAGATPTFEEYDNTGAGSTTTARKYETSATAAVTYDTLWGGSSSWADLSF